MASGEVHKLYHDKLYLPAIALGIIESIFFYLIKVPFYNPITFMVFYLIFYYLGERYISPDLDLLSMTNQESRLFQLKKKNIILGLIGLFWMIMCLVYAWTIGKHRSFWSHSLPFGTIFRVIWFILIPLLFITNWIASFNEWLIKDWFYQFYCEYWLINLLLGSFFSLLFGDSIHSILDSSYFKRINIK